MARAGGELMRPPASTGPAARRRAPSRLAGLATALALAGALVASCLPGCAARPQVDAGSPRCVSADVAAGSELTESSQYVEVRLGFDGDVEVVGDAVADLDVLVDGREANPRAVQARAWADGRTLVVRLAPTPAADGSRPSVYFALYGGLVSVAARSEDGGLPHVRATGGPSSAVIPGRVSFTAPSGVRVGDVESVPASAEAGTPATVSFDVESPAQLRCCTWFSFGDGVPMVMMHNHEFLRDTPRTCALRLADTINADAAGTLCAHARGTRVEVSMPAAADGRSLGVEVVEGRDVDPSGGGLL